MIWHHVQTHAAKTGVLWLGSASEGLRQSGGAPSRAAAASHREESAEGVQASD